MTAIQNAAAAVGVRCKDGIVIAGEKKVTSALLAPAKTSEKMYKVDDHVFAAVAGLSADANILVQQARLAAQRYKYAYNEPQPVEQLVQLIADYKHAYTQRGGLRPFGVGFLFAGWDKHYGFQLYQSEPSGTYSGWKATAMGNNSQSANSSLKTDYKEGLSFQQAQELAVKVLCKAMDTANPSSEKLEVAVLTMAEDGVTLVQKELTAAEVDALISVAVPAAAGATAARGDI